MSGGKATGRFSHFLRLQYRNLTVGKPPPAKAPEPSTSPVDSGLPVIYGRDDVKYVKCSDEHGVVMDPQGILKVNDKLKLVPGHCDPTANVHDWYVGLRGGKVECLWPVSARGRAY